MSVKDWKKREEAGSERGAELADKEIAGRTLKKSPSSQSSSWIVLLFQLQLFISFQTISPSSFENTHSYLPFQLHPSLYRSLYLSLGLMCLRRPEKVCSLCLRAGCNRLVNWNWTFDTWAKMIQVHKLKSILGKIGRGVFVVWWLQKWTSDWRIASSIPQGRKI